MNIKVYTDDDFRENYLKSQNKEFNLDKFLEDLE